MTCGEIVSEIVLLTEQVSHRGCGASRVFAIDARPLALERGHVGRRWGDGRRGIVSGWWRQRLDILSVYLAIKIAFGFIRPNGFGVALPTGSSAKMDSQW